MSVSTVSTQFSHSQIGLYRNWYERIPYTALDTALANLGTDLVNVASVAQSTGGQKIALLSDLAATQTAQVSLVLNQPAGETRYWTQALNPGLLPAIGEDRASLSATGTLGLQWMNETGSALTTTQQANYVIAVKSLTTWEKVQRGLIHQQGWTPLDDTLWALFQHQSVRPMTLREALRLGWTIQESGWTTQVVNVGTGLTPIGPYQPSADFVYVLHTLAASIPSGSVGNLIQLQVIRDNEDPLWTLLLDNTAGLQYPWHPWVTAQNQLGFRVTATTATNGVVLRLGWYKVRKTRVLQALMGDLDYARLSGASQTLYAQIAAGVIPV
jgi:hypothetical protein